MRLWVFVNIVVIVFHDFKGDDEGFMVVFVVLHIELSFLVKDIDVTLLVVGGNGDHFGVDEVDVFETFANIDFVFEGDLVFFF